MLFIVLPVYNEAEALPLLLEDITETCSELPYQVVIVNDGSNDQTAEVLAAWVSADSPVEVITHPENLGLSEALLSGFQWVNTHCEQRRGGEQHPGLPRAHGDEETVDELAETDLVITLDADNTHPADRIIPMYERIQQGADLVIASRYAVGGCQIGLGVIRRFLSLMASWLMKLCCPVPDVRDYSCGYRAYRLEILGQGLRLHGKDLIESRSFAGMVELLLKLAPLCQSIVEIPLELHYERKAGVSKMKVWATIWGYFVLIYHLKRRSGSRLEWVEE